MIGFRRAVDFVFFGCLVGTVILCAGWAFANGPTFKQQYGMQRIASQVISGASFQPGTLEDVVRISRTNVAGCRASALRSETIILLRLYENSIALAQRDRISVSLRSLETVLNSALECSPTDAFMWLLKYWLEINKNGVSPAALEFLRASYLLGPNEGWIIAKRTPLALAAFSQLPEDITSKVILEFAGLVRSGLFQEAADIISGPGWPNRSVLLSALADMDDWRKFELYRASKSRGTYLEIPGFTPAARRPWN